MAEEKKALKGEVITSSSLEETKKDLIKSCGNEIKDYVFEECIQPMLKDTLFAILDGIGDGVRKSISYALFGEDAPEKRRRGSRRRKESYSREIDDRRRGSRRRKESYSREIDDVRFEFYDDALDVLETLERKIDKYGDVSVAEFYEAIGEDSDFTDNDYGWTNLRNAYVHETSGGRYKLVLPRPYALK